jgi:N-acetyl-anhydromuramyl-L-alanine amidase AmpD
MKSPLIAAVVASLVAACATGCRPQAASPPTPAAATPRIEANLAPATPEPRMGDEIVVAGHYFHTGTPVVLWTDPGGYDAYRVERRFSPIDRADYATSKKDNPELTSPNRYGLRLRDQDRKPILTPEQVEVVRGGAWPLDLLQDKVDQFVIHYDVCGTSRRCFQVLQDQRDLSVQFMLDIDGTIYQTLDCKERAWQASQANTRSVGIEIANIGSYSLNESTAPLAEWYAKDEFGRTRITIPARFQPSGIRTPNFVGYPFYPHMVVGEVQGRTQRQYDFTPQQYRALAHLTATLCTVFPKIKCDYPRDENGQLLTHALTNDQLRDYQGVLGHYHVQTNKSDPGPAFQWDLVIDNARALMAGH